jgi:hypothetical protein
MLSAPGGDALQSWFDGAHPNTQLFLGLRGISKHLVSSQARSFERDAKFTAH